MSHPFPPPAPGPVPPPGHQDPPPAQIRLTLQKSSVTFGGMLLPIVLLNGHLMQARWGENLYYVPPGPCTVDVRVKYMWEYGRASLPLQLAPNESTSVWYHVPDGTWSRGAIGHEPQKSPDRALLWLILALVVAAIVAGVVLAVAL